MAPRIGRGERSGVEEKMQALVEKVAELNKYIAETRDYVGGDFPEEVRKIHYGEAERREIYGEATQGEAERLRDEGIPVVAIPWLRRNDS